MRGLHVGVLVLSVLLPRLAHADVTFNLIEADNGLADPTPRKPIGGNPGTTLGAQRRNVLDRVLATWSKQLESDVPIAVEVSFPDLGCNEDGATVAQTSINYWISIKQADGQAPVVYPSALANRVAGIDHYPDSPDFSVQINGSLDTPECHFLGAYYGFESSLALESPYLLSTLLHEFAHGLGFSSGVFLRSGGTMSPDGVDVFSAHIRDLDLDRTWGALTAAERALSAVNVRRLVFDGAATNAASAHALHAGTAALTFEPAISGFTGWVGDTSFGQNPALSPVRGPLVATYGADLCAKGVAALPAGSTKPVLLVEDTIFPMDTGCRLSELIERAHAGGAAGLLLPFPTNGHLPVDSLNLKLESVALPIVTVSLADASAIAQAGVRRPLTAVLGGRKDQLEGADPLGRPLLYATTPIANGSSISHFDTLARPNLLMEPYTTNDDVDDLDLTVPVLRDLGWTVRCGNGKLDGKEACDEGDANSDRDADHCRTTCRKPGCGDGVLDMGEACDNASQNSDTTPGACRTSCVRARCGDGVLDSGEACDLGPANGGTAKGACRTDCTMIGCGDGVLDAGEACDNGQANRDSVPNACRTTCLAPTCGDHVVDSGEACDGDVSCTAHCTRDAIVSWHAIENTPAAPPSRAHHSGCSVTRAQSSHLAPLTLMLGALLFLTRRRRNVTRS